MIFPSHWFFKIFHKFLLDTISIPLEGSSKKIIWLPPIKDIAIDSFLLCPPDKFLANVYWISFIWKSFSDLDTSIFIFSSEQPLKIANISKCSLTFKSSNNISCWGHIPNFSLKISILLLSNILYPLYIAFPSVDSYIPVNIDINVVLPAPFCPNKAKISSL